MNANTHADFHVYIACPGQIVCARALTANFLETLVAHVYKPLTRGGYLWIPIPRYFLSLSVSSEIYFFNEIFVIVDGIQLSATKWYRRVCFPDGNTKHGVFYIYLPARRIFAVPVGRRLYAFNARRLAKKKNRNFTTNQVVSNRVFVCENYRSIHTEYTRTRFWTQFSIRNQSVQFRSNCTETHRFYWTCLCSA